MNRTITCTINGKKRSLAIDVRKSLLEVLREQLGLTSVKQGCTEGECGACTVLIDGQPIDACIYLAAWADGKTIRTVEDLGKGGKLSKTQQAFVDEGAVQCGFCTPGFILSADSLVENSRGGPMTREEIRAGLAGNLCRCTGYESIVRAVEKSLDEP